MHIGEGLIGQHCFEQIINDSRFGGIPKILETPKENDMDRNNLALLKRLGKKKAARKCPKSSTTMSGFHSSREEPRRSGILPGCWNR